MVLVWKVEKIRIAKSRFGGWFVPSNHSHLLFTTQENISGIQDTSFSTYYNLCLHTVIELQLVRKNLKNGEDNPKNLKHVH